MSASTGGPECLHELGFHIKKYFKIKTIMVYLPLNIDKPVHKNFFNLDTTKFLLKIMRKIY